MSNAKVLNKEISTWIDEYPSLQEIIDLKESIWINPLHTNFDKGMENVSLSEADVLDAEARLNRFAPYIAKVFPETQSENGIIESPIAKIDNMKATLEEICGKELVGNLLLKCDSHLKVSGSIKARGGIYEVLKHAEDLALANNIISLEDNYAKLDSDEVRKFFSQYSVVVGSTGNLGLSIGIMSAKLGFKVTVHMSADARQWKKDLLRSRGVEVIEYESDYSKAVEEGRKQAEADANSYFVDDENSKNLFLGYSVAAKRLNKQLKDMNVKVDDNHPLFVYLPCGVGGGPGGVAFGLKLLYKDNVHFFFAEPTHSPCMLIGCMTGEHDKVSVQDFGIDNITAADGLAVGRASGFVGKTLEKLMSGCYSVTDENMYRLLTKMADSENIFLEPSALAGVPGIINILTSEEGKKYLKANNLEDKIENITHIAWATGGSMVPKDMMDEYYNKGVSLLK
ncbi:D-serine ammonia-lyase [Romboutsia hominis]|uniref:Probable D-serine dehydratase n=1 Tax=Romboutsia hominis TaxID=1507512 RepID=A0A2P2BN39_9FIRM|nr:D-serine ammonia-lyase [Romboutsia hominis]MCH1958516.1 D-serine ammonia-lyase [Romboutsia hominis]MCH1970432.1 D-serine ammonia-lyase [Romboutsia hominis]CEI71810.1 D-serine dehydratase [Romboutsia hominis]